MTNTINTDELDEILEHVIEIVKISRLPCWVIGDLDSNMIYSLVFGNAETAAGAVDTLGIAGASILKGILIDEERRR
jgi:hypothetical protein